MPINLPELLTPISDASPSGDDLLFSNEFDAIQDARRYDDPTLDQGEWVTEIKEADWGFVVDHAGELLRTRTKDLRLAVWLTEALALEDGITGLTEGYALLEGLCRDYWDTETTGTQCIRCPKATTSNTGSATSRGCPAARPSCCAAFR